MTGQIAVGNVILNRVASPQFPDTVQAVIFDRKDAVQFEPVGNGRIYQSPSETSVEAARQALAGENIIGDALYFYAPRCRRGCGSTPTAPINRPSAATGFTSD